MTDYNRIQMQEALSRGFLTYVVQQELPTTYHRSTQQEIELMRNSPQVHCKVKVLVGGVMAIIDENLELL